jgi:RND family efflux transporter MFP subunit
MEKLLKNSTLEPKSMLQKLSVPIVTLIGLLLAVAWLAGLFDEKIPPGIAEAEVHASQNVYTVTRNVEAIYEPIAASVAAKQASTISSRVLARIEKINVRAGDSVKKGDLLVQLEQSDLQAQVIQAKEQIKIAQVRKAEAGKNFNRAKEIHSQQLISDFEFDKNKADYDAVSAELTTAEQALKQAETTLSYTELRAPMDGRVVDRFAEPGNTAQPGNKLLSIYNPLSLWVEGQVREQLALTLVQGQTIEVQLPTLNKTLKAQIEEIVPAANTGSRSFLVKASISYQEQLLPGMYARLLVPAGEQELLYVPKERVGHVGQLSMVWVSENGVVQRRYIRLGKEHKEGYVAVIAGIKAGDKILTVQSL